MLVRRWSGVVNFSETTIFYLTFCLTSYKDKVRKGVIYTMARIILSDILNDIRNSIGAHTYSNWKGINYIREKAALVGNPRSLAQGIYRGIVEKYSRRWFGTLTDDQRSLWEAMAASLGDASKSDQTQGQHQIIPISRKVLSGMNAFIKTNALLSSAALAQVDDAPLGKDGPPSPTNLSVVYVAGPPEKFTLTWLEPVNMPVDAVIRVWGMSAKFCHKQFRDRVAAGVKTEDLTNFRGAKGGYVGLPADFYRFQVDAISADGLKSFGSNIAGINKTT